MDAKEVQAGIRMYEEYTRQARARGEHDVAAYYQKTIHNLKTKGHG